MDNPSADTVRNLYLSKCTPQQHIELLEIEIQLNHVRPAFANVLLAAGFSPNLQKFLKKHPHFTQIHFDPTDKIWYIGYMDENNIWCGAKFLDVLCRGRQASTFSYAKSVYMQFVERSEQFWNCAEYMGRRMFGRWYW